MVTTTKGKRKAAGDDEKVVKKSKKEEEKTKKSAEKKETTKKDTTKPKKETKKETKKEPKKETKKEPKKETKKETKKEAKKETKKEDKETKKEDKKETKKEAKKEDKKEAKKETKKEAKPKKETVKKEKKAKPEKETKKKAETKAPKEKKEKKDKEDKKEKETKKEDVEKDEKAAEDKKDKKKDSKRKSTASGDEPKAKKQKVEAEPKFKIDVKLEKVADVLVMGSGEVGQLGLGTKILGRKRPTVVTELQAKHILQLEVGGLHNAVLVQDAAAPANTRLWTWGCNDNKILGRDTPVQADDNVDLSMVPDVVPALNDKNIVSVSSGEFHMCALSQTGQLYLWGTYKDNEGFLGYSKDQRTEQAVPRIFPGLEDVAIKQVASAHNHTIALTSTGDVLIWGFHWLGKKVSDRGKRDYLKPQRINFRKKGKNGKKPKIVHVDAGGYQSFAVAEDGTVYAWGLNNYGQLGTGNTTDTGAPTEVPGLSGKRIVSIAAGLHHTIALGDDGKVYSFGRGDYGQLGHGNTQNSLAVQEIAFFSNLLANGPTNKVIQITSIDNHCTAVTANGSLYAWGFGDRGQIGNATADIDGEDATTPFKVEGPQLKTRTVISAGAGGQHTAMLGVTTEETAAATPATSSSANSTSSAAPAPTTANA